MKNVIIVNSKELKSTKEKIAEEGKGKIHVITDFDRTLTKAFVNSKRVPSLISVLRDEGYLTVDYSDKAKALYEKYHKIELDPKIPISEKKKKMQEWWEKHFDLLIESNLNKRDLEKVVNSGNIRLRRGTLKFLDFLHKHKIPLVIISSSGLGVESISLYLENKKRLYDNIHIISNSFEWDEDGYAIRVKKPIIHSMNKDETTLKEHPFYDKIKDRKNVLLLGDSLGDLKMIKGFSYKNLIKIGFLNEKIKESLTEYKRGYDIVILNDAGMDYVNKLLREIVK